MYTYVCMYTHHAHPYTFSMRIQIHLRRQKHRRPRRGPTGLRGRARQRAPQRLGESGVRVLGPGRDLRASLAFF